MFWSTRAQTEGARLQQGIAQEVIRFHVRANSDTTLDQEVKMQVKEAVISYLQPFLKNVYDIADAKEQVSSRLTEIRREAEAVLTRQGCDYDALVSLRKEYFPQKTYGACTFPAGIYWAVVIELGSGQGHNWWCMLYPGLCFVEEAYAVVADEEKQELKQNLTEEAYDWVTNPENRRITFRWEWLRSVSEDVIGRICGRKTGNP